MQQLQLRVGIQGNPVCPEAALNLLSGLHGCIYFFSRKMPLLLYEVFLLLCLFGEYVQSCTLIVAGKKATADGSVIVAHTDDAGGSPSDLRLVRVPAAHHDKKAVRPVFATYEGGYPRLVTEHRGPHYQPRDGQKLSKPLGFIPQVEYTHGYWDNEYGLINDVGLAIGETTCGAKTAGWPLGEPFGHSLFSINELSRVALERCRTARCAVETMGRLAEEYGFYGDDSGPPEKPLYIGSSEALGLVDAEGEGWIFHVMTGLHNRSAIWAAQRVEDKQVCVVPNGFTIRQLNLSDHRNFLASKNVLKVAQDQGWWNPADGPFDFTATYSPFDPSPVRSLYVGRRLWRLFDLLAPSLKLDMREAWRQAPTYPFAVTPDKPLTLAFLRQILRDHFEGTVLDMTKGVGAGPFGNPVRFDGNRGGGGWERQVSMYRASYSYIAQTRPLHDPLSGVLWYGLDAPHGSVYVPFYGSQDRVPKAYLTGVQSKFSMDSAWWAFNFVNNWIQLKYSYMIKDVQEEQNHLEPLAEKEVAKWDRHAHKMCRQHECEAEVAKYLGEETCRFAEEVVDSHWQLALKLIAKYSNGNILVGEGPHDLTVPGYPAEWLNHTEYAQYPAPGTWLPDGQAITKRLAETTGLPQGVVLLSSLALALGVFLVALHPCRAAAQYEYLP
eukprot:GGOE01002168.1.p1 GENE.GGOE01002168.1~~GGOE01002168.1.p1  ORF type:complete len:665 (-),score=199.28 GGOE01002168.1:289-2283(-)